MLGNALVLERSTVRIDQVDTSKKLCHVVDKTGSKFQVSYVVSPASFQIPAQGEHWTIFRHGHMWHLDSRFDNPDEKTKFDLQPGDVHMRTPGNLHIDSQTINTGSGPISATTRDVKVFTGTTTTMTLSATPVHPHTVQVYKNTGFLHPDLDWTISGSTITFAANVVSNDKVTVYYQRTGALYLDAGTVTTLADMSSSLDLPYKDISTETAVAVISAWESR